VERRIVNPWTWQERAGFVQANEVVAASRVLYCSGVVSVDDGASLDAYMEARPAIQERLALAGCRYAATLLGVSRLARPELLIELEATAVA
jgi:enamine deaminase RidA (YjgF/YER057c/UK114 family)